MFLKYFPQICHCRLCHVLERLFLWLRFWIFTYGVISQQNILRFQLVGRCWVLPNLGHFEIPITRNILIGATGCIAPTARKLLLATSMTMARNLKHMQLVIMYSVIYLGNKIWFIFIFYCSIPACFLGNKNNTKYGRWEYPL